MSDDIECRACVAGLSIVWHVQSKKYMHLAPGLSVEPCKRIDNSVKRKRTSETAR